MSSNVPISQSDITAPTPQNTPLTQAPIALEDSEPTETDGNDSNLPPGAHSAILGLVQGRLADLVGKSSGYIESLPVEVKKSIEALKGVQVKQNELQNQFRRECLELEKKYLELQKPLYERRLAIISGAAKATQEEIDAGTQASQKDNEEYTPIPADAPGDPAPIPEFWLTALRNHVGLSELITERDAAALKHLTDIRLSYLPSDQPKPGFKIAFHFSPNEYFENEILEKTYLYQEEVGYSGDFVYDRAIGTEIKWKEDKDLTKEFEIKKAAQQKRYSDLIPDTNRTRLVRKARPTDSFFNFFSPPVPPAGEDELDDDDLEDLEEKLETDYQIGEDLKEKIIPRAIDYFTGKALEYDMLDEEDDFDDFDDDDDEGGFDDDDSESDNEPPARRRGPPKGRGGSGAVNPEECKNQ
ncbi:nucleosome assembly protein [Pisolithus sp. B1]|nr:nucleosome assembly protein [Pisolithus sp. B1]